MNCSNHPDREHVAFCQNCGKPLCQECTRVVGSAVFCEQCLAARLAGAPAPGVPTGTYTETPAGGSYNYTGNAGGINYNVSGTTPPPPLPGEPNPGLAALLGFIPGVGAMYNGQYAKGVVHLVVFAILVSLANENGIFGLFIAGWVCYQVIEAHQTARARRDGTPLPNPFGLNDLGERLGFGKAWPATAPNTTASAVPPAGAPFDPAYTAPVGSPYTQSAPGWSNPWQGYAPPAQPYGTAPIYPLDPALASVPRNRFPTGAIWLIGLGCLFLIGNAGFLHSFPIHYIFPFVLIGFGVWLFVRKMTDTGSSLSDDGTPAYQYRLFRALRGSIWVILVGILFLLDQHTNISWGRSWPLFIIVAGLMAIFQRTSYNSAMATPYPYAPPPVAPVTPPPAETGTSIVPSTQHDQEGR
jgi:cell wall-active antibiotic response 4TMS protein YvqF